MVNRKRSIVTPRSPSIVRSYYKGKNPFRSLVCCRCFSDTKARYYWAFATLVEKLVKESRVHSLAKTYDHVFGTTL